MITPYYFQREAVDSIYAYFNSGKKGNPLICLPTGTGKSVVIAVFVSEVLTRWPNQRMIMATHSKELISQNHKRLLEVWPHAPVGISSAGLKLKDTQDAIIFGGIASMYKNPERFGHRDFLFIDEAHLLSPNAESMYQIFIQGLRKINPAMVVIGATATAFRMGQGNLHDGGLFTDICYDLTSMAGFNKLVAEGFLSPIYPKRTKTELDISGVGLSNGDFAKGELEIAVDKKDLTTRILKELVYEGGDRHHWLIFASGVSHSDHIAEILNNEFGISAVSIHSKISQSERDDRIDAFKSGDVRCAVNNNVLTTGFDFPAIDLIGMMRPTMSPGLWVQMCGRATRPSPSTGKVDAIVLDFAGNTRRLGPINDPVKPRKKGEAKGDAPVRICPECSTYCHASARECYACGHIFTFAEKLKASASEAELIRTDTPIIETYQISKVIYKRHVSKKRPDAKPCLQVQYLTKGLRQFTEWWHLDASGSVGHESRQKWLQRAGTIPPTPATCAPYPSATDAALSVISQLREPKEIRVWCNRPMPEIMSVSF